MTTRTRHATQGETATPLNELAALTGFLSILRMQLAQFPTTVAEDLVLLGHAEAEGRELCARSATVTQPDIRSVSATPSAKKNEGEEEIGRKTKLTRLSNLGTAIRFRASQKQLLQRHVEWGHRRWVSLIMPSRAAVVGTGPDTTDGADANS